MNSIKIVATPVLNNEGKYYNRREQDYENKKGEVVKQVSYSFYLDGFMCTMASEPDVTVFDDMICVTGEIKTMKYQDKKSKEQKTMQYVEVKNIKPFAF